jgi:hypothetical protein
MRFYILLLFLVSGLCFSNSGFSQQADTSLNVRDFSEPEIQNYRSSHDFDYGTDAKANMGVAEWIINEILNWIGRTFIGTWVGKLVYYLIIVAALAGVALLLFRSQLMFPIISRRKSKLKFTPITDDIYAEDLEQLMNKAFEAKAYREAIRFAYLLFLRQLSEEEFIQWQLEKTSKQYQYEIQNVRLREEFTNHTSDYNYVWYGLFVLPETQFVAIFDAIRASTKDLKQFTRNKL